MKNWLYLLLAFALCNDALAQTYVPDQRPKAGQVAYTNKANTFNKAQTFNVPLAPAALPVASSSAKGVIQGDGSTLTISGPGVESCTTATSSQIGCAKFGTGMAVSAGNVTSNAEDTISFQPGLLTSVTNTKGVFGKFVKTSTVDNIEASAILFTCVSNPTITLYECGTSATCSVSPTTIGFAIVTTTGTVVDGSITSATITAGDYVAWAISAGTCTSLDISATAQVHSN